LAKIKHYSSIYIKEQALNKKANYFTHTINNKETNPREIQVAADPTTHSALQRQLYDAREPAC
jgi:hypothetical protein